MTGPLPGQHGAHHQDGHHGGHHGGTPDDDAAFAELLDLDAEVLQGYLDEVMTWLAQRVGVMPCRRILDLGAGTGTGTLALLERFPDAHVTALDISPGMLARLERSARDRGVAPRLATAVADLDGEWSVPQPVDLVWAAASLHHVADPDRALREIFAALRPGGLLVVTEMDAFPRYLPDDVGIGLPGWEERCQEAVAQARSERMPHFGADWAPYLRRAGFDVEPERVFTVDLTAPLPGAAPRAAQLSLERLRAGVADRVSAEDLATLDTLIGTGPDGVLQRGDLRVRATRRGWIGRRP